LEVLQVMADDSPLGLSKETVDGVYTRVYTSDMAKRASNLAESGSERMMFSLPKALAAELEEYARVLRQGNKSGFVADAVRAYIDHFRRRRHTALLRQSYAAAAKAGGDIAREWEPLDEETWSRLDELEQQAKNTH
jgi:hypothetical protein